MDYPDKIEFTRTRANTERAPPRSIENRKTSLAAATLCADGGLVPGQYSVSKYFADCCCVPLKLVVEIDGIAHDAVADSIRDHRINERGFDVLRFTVQEIDSNLEGVVETIYREVQLRLMANKHRPR
jgi:very-short-patch-repair endonuclease